MAIITCQIDKKWVLQIAGFVFNRLHTSRIEDACNTLLYKVFCDWRIVQHGLDVTYKKGSKVIYKVHLQRPKLSWAE